MSEDRKNFQEKSKKKLSLSNLDELEGINDVVEDVEKYIENSKKVETPKKTKKKRLSKRLSSKRFSLSRDDPRMKKVEKMINSVENKTKENNKDDSGKKGEKSVKVENKMEKVKDIQERMKVLKEKRKKREEKKVKNVKNQKETEKEKENVEKIEKIETKKVENEKTETVEKEEPNEQIEKEILKIPVEIKILEVTKEEEKTVEKTETENVEKIESEKIEKREENTVEVEKLPPLEKPEKNEKKTVKVKKRELSEEENKREAKLIREIENDLEKENRKLTEKNSRRKKSSNRLTRIVKSLTSLDFIEFENNQELNSGPTENPTEIRKSFTQKKVNVENLHQLLQALYKNILIIKEEHRKFTSNSSKYVIDENNSIFIKILVPLIIKIVLHQTYLTQMTSIKIFSELSLNRFLTDFYSFSIFHKPVGKSIPTVTLEVVWIKFLLQRKSFFSVIQKLRQTPSVLCQFYQKGSLMRDADNLHFFQLLLLQMEEFEYNFSKVPLALATLSENQLENQLKVSVTTVIQYFFRKTKEDKVKLKVIGREEKNPEIFSVLHDNFSRSLFLILSNGMKEENSKFFIFSNQIDLWKIIQSISKKIQSKKLILEFRSKTQISMETMVNTISKIFRDKTEYHRKTLNVYSRFYYLISFLLNCNCLNVFMEIFFESKKILKKNYNQNSILFNEEARKKICKFIDPLNKLPFNLIIG